MHNSLLKSKRLTLYLADNGKKDVVIRKKEFLRCLQATLEVLGGFLSGNQGSLKIKEDIELSLTLCGDQKIQTLNSQYRNKNSPTDVLSFPMYDSLRSKKDYLEITGMGLINLGDIIISKNVARKQAKNFVISFEQELIHLFVHGFLHLLGYDHEISSQEEKVMEDLEQKIVKKIYSKLGFKGAVITNGRIQ